jgi:2'-5' RNA ligase
MQEIRRQLTLFIGDEGRVIEQIRAEFNPLQYQLIAAHVTLCRENEIEALERVISNLREIKWAKPLKIEFDQVERFADGRGVFIPAKISNPGFDNLRVAVLKGINYLSGKHNAHITLMHPRNSTCTDDIFERIKQFKLPAELYFNKISLIEQHEGGKWVVIEEL